MGVTKRYTIAYKGLKPGLHDFRFEVDGSLFEEFESPEIKDGACEVTVALERGEAYARRYGGRKRRRGVRPLSGRVPDSRALSGTAAGEVLRRGARIRR